MRFALIAFLLAAPAVQAARPLVTDDTRIVDPGGCQIEAFYKRQREFRKREFWFLPACNPWGPVELSLGAIRVDSTHPGDSRALLAQGKVLLKAL